MTMTIPLHRTSGQVVVWSLMTVVKASMETMTSLRKKAPQQTRIQRMRLMTIIQIMSSE